MFKALARVILIHARQTSFSIELQMSTPSQFQGRYDAFYKFLS